MIGIKIHQDAGSLQLVVDGHAGYAGYGHDIVCAGVSVLTSTLANLIRDMGEAGALDFWSIYPEDKPQRIYARAGGDAAVSAVFRTFAGMYEQLAEQYPDYIRLEHV